jgi:cytochrome P450
MTAEIPESHAGAVRMYGPEFAADPAAFYRETRAARGPVTPVLLVDEFAGDGEADLIAQYTVRMVPMVLSRLIAHPAGLTGGHRIGRGDFIVLGLAAANADPAARPDSLTASGGNRAHLAYAHGEHSCPVAARELASQIVTLGVEILLDRIPDVRLSVPAEELRWTESTWLRSLESLPVSFAPAAGSPASA